MLKYVARVVRNIDDDAGSLMLRDYAAQSKSLRRSQTPRITTLCKVRYYNGSVGPVHTFKHGNCSASGSTRPQETYSHGDIGARIGRQVSILPRILPPVHHYLADIYTAEQDGTDSHLRWLRPWTLTVPQDANCREFQTTR